MGVYSPQQFVGKLGELNAVVGTQVPRRGIEAASLVVKTNVMALAPGRLRGVGKRGARLGVRYTIAERGSDVTSLVRATGPFQLIERNTKAHVIPREQGSRGRTRYAVFGGNVYSRVNHPGTKGKHPFEKGSLAAIPAIHKIFEEGTSAACRGVFL